MRMGFNFSNHTLLCGFRNKNKYQDLINIYKPFKTNLCKQKEEEQPLKNY